MIALAFFVLLLVAFYFFLDRSGALDELTETFNKRNRPRTWTHPEMNAQGPPDPEAEKRLEIFEEFIDQLDPNEDEEE